MLANTRPINLTFICILLSACILYTLSGATTFLSKYSIGSKNSDHAALSVPIATYIITGFARGNIILKKIPKFPQPAIAPSPS